MEHLTNAYHSLLYGPHAFLFVVLLASLAVVFTFKCIAFEAGLHPRVWRKFKTPRTARQALEFTRRR
jgi:hypothetical protein